MDNGAKLLVDMAQLENRLFDLRRKLKAFPRRLEDARRQLNAEEGLLNEIEVPWKELEHQVIEKEATIQVALDTIEKFEQHIKRVTTQKEYVAANKQVEEARSLNDQLQNEILENRVKQEELEPKLKDVREHYNNVLDTFQTEEAKILKEQKAVAKEAGEQEERIKELMGQMGAEFWDYYQKLVKGGKQPAIVQAIAGTCGGCNMTIPPQSYNLMIANADKIHTCSQCSRIIYYNPADDEVSGEVAISEPPAAEAATGS